MSEGIPGSPKGGSGGWALLECRDGQTHLRWAAVFLALTYALLPLWWLIGVEQLIWPLALGSLALGIAIQRGASTKLPSTGKWLLLFIGAQIVSAFFIVESIRYVTFLRNLSTYVSAFFVLLVVSNALTGYRHVRFLEAVIVLLLGTASFLGLLGATGIWRPDFISPLGRLLPEWIRETTYGGEVASRNFGRLAYFFGIAYFRVDSLFLFPNQFGLVILTTFPLAFRFFLEPSSAPRRFFGLVVLGLAMITLLATTGRVALLAFAFGGLYAYGTGALSRHKRMILLAVATIVLMAGAVLGLSSVARAALADVVRGVLYARGPEAVMDRLALYLPTIHGIIERPFFGWGTERDIEGAIYPAGSHSYYLGILYRHGLIGFGLWAGMIWNLIRETKIADAREGGALPRAHQTRLWVLVSLGILSISVVPDLDAAAFAVVWLVLSVLLANRLLDDLNGR